MSTQPYLLGMESEQRKLDLSQWYTPAWLSLRLWKWAAPRPADRVLEPAAGRGALLAPMLRADPRKIVAFELDPNNIAALNVLARSHDSAAGWTFEIRAADFLAFVPERERFELCVMNPPYEGGQDCAFVERALLCCDRVVGVFRSAMLHADERRAFWQRVRPTRIAYQLSRPSFGTGEKSTSARGDFVVMELRKRIAQATEIDAGRVRCEVEWW